MLNCRKSEPLPLDLLDWESLALAIGPVWRQSDLVSSTTAIDYVHGYSGREAQRLTDQADTLATLLHAGTAYPGGTEVLEIGCGVGAQTVHLATANPSAQLTSVDISGDSLALARRRVSEAAPGARVRWCQADLHHVPFVDRAFDELFVCFVLEHLPDPANSLARLRRVLRPGGGITVIEGDHGSAEFYPDSAYAQEVIDAAVRLQAARGGDALLGRRLQPLLAKAGFRAVQVRPRTVYADHTRPALVRGFTTDTFIAMMESVREGALGQGLSTPERWAKGVADLHRTAAEDGTFTYTFFKATAVNPA